MRVCRILLAAVVCMSSVGAAPAQAPAQSKGGLPDRKTLTLDAARRVAAAAEAEARRNNWAVSVAVLDEAGHLMVFHRMDGAKLVSIDIAERKARTAVYFQGPTKNLEEEVSGGRTALLPIAGFMPLEGGVPLMADGVLVGAVGVSGVTGTQDGQCAQAGAAALTRSTQRFP
jgi:glc operon protein GlcG